MSDNPNSHHNAAAEFNEHIQGVASDRGAELSVPDTSPIRSVGINEQSTTRVDQLGYGRNNSISRDHIEEVNGYECAHSALSSHPTTFSDLSSDLDRQRAVTTITRESIENEKNKNKELESIRMNKLEELLVCLCLLMMARY